MEINKVQWRMIAKGEKLPCDSFLMKYDGTIPPLISGAGVVIGQNAYYLPVEELRTLPKEESKDERIRTKLLNLLKELLELGGVAQDTWSMNDCEQFIAYLEKQGEQKPAWSEEDEKFFKTALWHISYSISNGKSTDIHCDTTDWFKSLKDRVQPQPKQWSEEDERRLNSIIDRTVAFGDSSIHGLIKDDIDWLKSIRPQSQWKPSDEQMRVLDLAIRCGINRGTTEETTLVSLFNDLKKLKG